MYSSVLNKPFINKNDWIKNIIIWIVIIKNSNFFLNGISLEIFLIKILLKFFLKLFLSFSFFLSSSVFFFKFDWLFSIISFPFIVSSENGIERK
jgi:hypothetical protein